MKTIQRFTAILSVLLLVLLWPGALRQGQGEASQPTIINLYPDGPQPQQLAVAAGAAIVWVSHLAYATLVVVTVAFHEGQKVVQATVPLEGYNGFVLEGHDFLGRMQGDGGKVALRFVTPGAYTYSIDHGRTTGTLVVH